MSEKSFETYNQVAVSSDHALDISYFPALLSTKTKATENSISRSFAASLFTIYVILITIYFQKSGFSTKWLLIGYVIC